MVVFCRCDAAPEPAWLETAMKPTLIFLLTVLGTLAPARAAEAPTPAQRLAALGITLPRVAPPVASYVPAVRAGNLVFLAGTVARGPDGAPVTGKLGREIAEAGGTALARQCAIQLLAALQAEVGDLAKVKRIVRVGGFVNGTDDFTAQSRVINGASDLLVAVFGDAGKHARTAVGVNSLPFGAPVEVELVAEIEMER
jgi:enamine deaminase RidA (YjgF/YER057c/UK114 family)